MRWYFRWFEKAVFCKTAMETFHASVWQEGLKCVASCQNSICELQDWDQSLCDWIQHLFLSLKICTSIACNNLCYVFFYVISFFFFPSEVTHRSLVCLFWMHFKERVSGQVKPDLLEFCSCHTSSAGLCFYAFQCLNILAHGHCKPHKQVDVSVVKWWTESIWFICVCRCHAVCSPEWNWLQTDRQIRSLSLV